MTSKIRIRMGAVEVEYEGSEAFLKEELPSLLAGVVELAQKSGEPINSGSASTGAAALGTSAVLPGLGTTGTISAKLGVKSGPDLILAACARLTFVAGTETFTRKQITKEMQAATGYYKKTYLNNLSQYLQSLVKEQKLVEMSTDTYALNASLRKELEAKFAQS